MSQRFRVSQQQGLRDRTALLGTPDAHGFATPPASGRASPAGSMMNAHAYADDLEGQNEEHLEGLAAKVKLLKDIGLAVGNEVRESTKQLSEMNDAFSETSGILSGTFRRMNRMADRQGCRWMWYILFIVLVFWFFIVVWWFRR